MPNETNEVFKIVLAGSFRKHYAQIIAVVRDFEALKHIVLSPKISAIMNEGADFVVLESDDGLPHHEIEKLHLDAIYQADALYVVNPDGYIGSSAALEIGWASSFCKPIFFSNRCKENIFNSFGEVISTVDAVADVLSARSVNLHNTICKYTPIEGIQKYIQKVVQKRGFSNESARDILLLLVEEIGELAKVVRKFSGLKVDRSKLSSKYNLEEELADVFIYLLDLANIYGVDLYTAFHNKELANEKRTWTTDKCVDPGE